MNFVIGLLLVLSLTTKVNETGFITYNKYLFTLTIIENLGFSF